MEEEVQGVKLSQLTELQDVPDGAYLYVVSGNPPIGYKITKQNLVLSILNEIAEIESSVTALEGSTWVSPVTGVKYTRVNDLWVEI